MPSWMLLPLVLLGFTLVVPLWVLGMTAGNWREALRAWRFFAALLATMAVPAALISLWLWIFPPIVF